MPIPPTIGADHSGADHTGADHSGAGPVSRRDRRRSEQRSRRGRTRGGRPADAAGMDAPAGAPAPASAPVSGAGRSWGRRKATDAAALGSGAAAPLGRCTAVWGPHGSPGVSTIAVGVAAALAARGRRVLLIDADVYGGAIAPYLGIADEAPGFAAACRLAGAGGLSDAELERVSSAAGRPDARFRVLSGIANPARWPELSGRRVREVIEVVRARFDDIVIDTGFKLETDEELLSDVAAPRRNAATLAAIECADRIVAVGEGTPVGLQRHLRGRAQLGALLADPASVLTVANRIRTSAVGVDAAGQVRHVLQRFGGISDPVLLVDDPRACDRALGDGMPIVDAAPRSGLARGVVRLADLLDATAPPARVVHPSTSHAGAAP